MFSRIVLVLIAFGPLSWISAQEGGKEGDAVREIDVKGLLKGQPRGQVAKPTVIANEEELKNAFKDSSDAVAKKVNFKAEKLVLFAWSGSGQDKLSFVTDKGEKGPLVLFHYQPGLTRDLRPHVHLFAMPKDATWKVVTKGRGE